MKGLSIGYGEMTGSRESYPHEKKQLATRVVEC